MAAKRRSRARQGESPAETGPDGSQFRKRERMRPRLTQRVGATTNLVMVPPPWIRDSARENQCEDRGVSRLSMAVFTLVWVSLTAAWCVLLIKSAMWLILLV